MALLNDKYGKEAKKLLDTYGVSYKDDKKIVSLINDLLAQKEDALGLNNGLRKKEGKGGVEENSSNNVILSEIIDNQNVLEQAFDIFHSGMRIIDLDFNIIKVNSVYAKMNNVSAKNIVGKKCFDFLSKHESDSHSCALYSNFDESKPEIKKLKSETVGIAEKDYLFSAVSLKNKQGKVIGILETFVDISEIKLSESKLKESEEKLRVIFEFSNLGIVLSTNDGIMYWVNPTFMKLLGYSDGELYDFSLQDLTYKDDLEKELIFYNKLLKGEITYYQIEKRLISKSDEIVWVNINVTCSRKQNGDVDYFIVIVEDVSERIRSTEEIKKLNVAIEQSPSSIVISNIDGDIEYVNPRFTSVTGFAFEEVLGKNPRILKADDHFSVNYKELWDTLKAGKIWEGEFLNKKKNGETFWEKAIIAPIKNENTVITHYLAIKDDITEKKKNEQLLQVEMAINRTIAEISKTIIKPNMAIDVIAKIVYKSSLELTNSEYGFVSIIDRETGNNIGHTLSEMMKGKCEVEGDNIVFPIGEKGYGALWGYALNEQKSFYTNDPSKHPSFKGLPCGHVPLYSFLSVPAVANNKLVGQIALANKKGGYNEKDIFVIEKIANIYALALLRKYTEDELVKAKEDADRANNAKSAFLANMSHEIRTPMNSIIGFANMLSTAIDDPSQKSNVKSIISSGNTLLSLINDILDLSKIEAGKMELNMEIVNLRNIFAELQHIFSIKVSNKGLIFYFDIPENFPKGIYVDELRMRQLLINTIGNAIKFTNEGFVKLSVDIMKIENDLMDFKISIIDTGIGISADLKDKIFDSFSQGDESIENKYEGTGLGLAICRRIIKLFNGDIKFESEPGMGSTFILTFNDIKFITSGVVIEKQEKINLLDYKFKTGKILIADDIYTNREVLKSILDQTGMEIIEVENGDEAVRYAAKDIPEIIFMDLRMPIMDGYEALKMLRENEKTKNIPVIAITASVLLSEQEKANSAGFNDFVKKPIETSVIIDKILKFLKYKKVKTKRNIKKKDNSKLKMRHLDNFNEIVFELENFFIKEWELLLKTDDFVDYEVFGKGVKDFGESNKVEELVDFGSQLEQFANSFDLENIRNVIGNFGQLVQNLKDAK